MSQFNDNERRMLDRVLAQRKGFKSLANVDATPFKQTIEQTDAVLGGTMPGYMATSPMALGVAQEAAANGVKLFKPQRFTPDPANVAIANRNLAESRRAGESDDEYLSRQGGVPVGDIPPYVEPNRPYGRVASKPVNTDTSKVTANGGLSAGGAMLESFGGQTRFSSQEMAQRREPTAGERKQALNTPQQTSINSDDFSIDIVTPESGKASAAFEPGQIVKSRDGFHYRNDAQIGQMTPVVFDTNSGEFINRDLMLEEWAAAHPTDPTAREINVGFQQRDKAITHHAEGNYTQGELEQALSASERNLNAKAKAIQLRGGRPQQMQQGQQDQASVEQDFKANTHKDADGNVWSKGKDGEWKLGIKAQDKKDDETTAMEDAKEYASILASVIPAFTTGSGESKTVDIEGAKAMVAQLIVDANNKKDAAKSDPNRIEIGGPNAKIAPSAAPATPNIDKINKIRDEMDNDPAIVSLSDDEYEAELRRRVGG